MAELPEARESKATRCPSEHQLGAPVSAPLKEVSWKGLLPSASASHISCVPDRFDSKTILVPSGEYCGTLCMRVEEINFFAEFAAFPAVRSTRQMLIVFDPRA